MATTMAVTFYTDVHVAKLSLIFDNHPDYFRKWMTSSHKTSKFQLFTTLATYFRNDRNYPAAQKFLKVRAKEKNIGDHQ